MRKFINKELLTKTLNIRVKNIKSITWDELSNWMQVVSAIVGAVTFIALIATVWVTLKANAEKDEKTRQQEQRLAEINFRVEEEGRKRAEAERALLELQERMRPRNLTEKQKTKLADSLKSIPRGKITFAAILSDQEARNFATKLGEIFTKAGWSVHFEEVAYEKPMTGLQIVFQNTGDQSATILYRLFESSGIEALGLVQPNKTTSSLEVVVGSKPLSDVMPSK